MRTTLIYTIYQDQRTKDTHGDYGIMVITGVCGTLNSGSIPGSRPDTRNPVRGFSFVWAAKKAYAFVREKYFFLEVLFYNSKRQKY